MQANLQTKKLRLLNAQKALKRTGYLPLHNLRLDIQEGRVRLEGVVPRWYMKQLAQEVVIKVDGVNEVDNALKIA
jgi:osmotically-inducible protein OsmY